METEKLIIVVFVILMITIFVWSLVHHVRKLLRERDRRFASYFLLMAKSRRNIYLELVSEYKPQLMEAEINDQPMYLKYLKELIDLAHEKWLKTYHSEDFFLELVCCSESLDDPFLEQNLATKKAIPEDFDYLICNKEEWAKFKECAKEMIDEPNLAQWL